MDRLNTQPNTTPLSESGGPADCWPALRGVLQASLPEFLLRQRWYPAKDAGIPTVAPIRLAPLETEGVTAAITIWQVTPPGRQPLKMFVPVAVVDRAPTQSNQLITAVEMPGGKGRGAIVDAFSVDPFVRAWVQLHLGVPGDALAKLLRVDQTPLLAESGVLAGEWRIRRGTAEQSNTSIRTGERAILKVFRKLEEGIHPELEVGRYLSQQGFAASPQVLGWIEALDDGPAPATLSVMQSFIPNRGDGWTWILEQLVHGLTDDDQAALLSTVEWLQALARRTAEMHRAFAANTEEAAFRPEQVGQADLQQWANAASGMAARAFQALEGGKTGTDVRTIQLTSELSTQKARVEGILARLPDLKARFSKTRHHGDFHLGQTLVVGADAIIIDFEGEPLRPIEERRAKHCVLRDVAGMLRSFSYAAAAAERALPNDITAEVRQAARTRLTHWNARASKVFTDSYFSAAEGISSVPPGRDDAQHLLRFFLLEKALYEVAYEKANRPDWIGIPVDGVLSILDQD